MAKQTLEEGDVFFLYRPKVDVARVNGLADVQRFFVVRKPRTKPVFRRMIIGRKRLPGLAEHGRTWAVIDLVTDDSEELEDDSIRSPTRPEPGAGGSDRRPGRQARASTP